MFFRVKPAGSYRYLQIAHSVREGKKVRQQVIATLGRLDLLQQSGQLDRLMRSGVRHCQSFAVLDAHAAGETQPVAVRKIGPDLVFGRLWQESGLPEALRALLKGRRFLTSNGPFISLSCTDCLPAAAIGPPSVGVRLTSSRVLKGSSSITSIGRWPFWAR